MMLFWAMAGLLAAGAAALVLAFAARARRGDEVDPDVALYRRQLAEVDDMRARGLLGDAEYGPARAEAARRLLAADARAGAPAVSAARSGPLLLGAVVLTAALALALYLAVGSPGREDTPYAERLAGWRARDPATLAPPEFAAVAQDLADRRGEDANAWRLLGRARLQTGEAFSAVRALERAAELGDTAEDFTALGEAIATFNGGEVNASASAAFSEALKRDPASVSARYGLALGRLALGDNAGGRAELAQLAASLPAGDPRRIALENQLGAATAPAQGSRAR